ncbi:MAG: DUF4881 domain-containing protein [Deltaproteobacteria bacterium]|nr:DUF4881 domain-containing protein [Deltaproteobacteria bacterium]
MAKKYSWITVLAVLPLVLMLGCGELGKVDQGRVIEYDKEKGTVTLIRDLKADPKKPDYSSLPPHIYAVPTDPGEMGPEPKAGKRMKLDTQKRQITIFDNATQNFKTIDFTLIDQKENVDKDNPLVYDEAADKAKDFPVVDREKKTIIVYSKRLKSLTTFSLPDEYFALPDDTWTAGDEVRIYYKEEGKARRFMNISKTDIYKK